VAPDEPPVICDALAAKPAAMRSRCAAIASACVSNIPTRTEFIMYSG
jgi:hypothetical protein